MRRIVSPIIVVLSLSLPASPVVGADAPREDTTQSVSRERLMEFWDAYTIESMHYGNEGVPNRIVGYFGRLDSTGSAINAAMGFLEANQDIFSISDVQTELTVGSIETDSLGERTVILQQICQGLDVVGGHLDFVFTPDGSLEVIKGRFYPDVQVSVLPQIDSLSAAGIVRDSLTRAGGDFGALECGLRILPQGGSFVLVWQADQPYRPERIEPIFVNALSGEIIPRIRF